MGLFGLSVTTSIRSMKPENSLEISDLAMFNLKKTGTLSGLEKYGIYRIRLRSRIAMATSLGWSGASCQIQHTRTLR